MSTPAQQVSALPTAAERRFYTRIVPLVPIYVAMDAPNQCLLLNLSENGLLLSTPTEFPCNFVARIVLPLNGLSKPVRVNVHVVWASESRKVAGLQLLDLSAHDREQIRKWGAQASAPSVQREAQREPNQVRIVTRSTTPSEKNMRTFAFTAKAPLSNQRAVALPASPTVVRRRATSPIVRITKWAALLAALCLVGIFFFRAGAVENLFAPFTDHRQKITIAPPSTQDGHVGLRTPDSAKPDVESSVPAPTLSTIPAKSKTAASSTPTLANSTESSEAKRDTEGTAISRFDTPQIQREDTRKPSTSAATPTFERHPTPDSSRITPNSRSSEPKAESTIAEIPAVNPAAPSSTATNSFPAGDATSTTAPVIPAPPALKAATANPPHPNDITPTTPATIPSTPNATSVPPASPRNSAIPQVIEMDPPARQVVHVHLPSGYRSPLFSVPGERVLESSSATMRIQRSVRMPTTHPRWPFHGDIKIVVGGLISRVDPQVAPVHARTGDVRVHATVAQDGRVESIRAIYGPGNLITAALEAVHEWRYQATLVDGKPVETQADVVIQFHAPPTRTARP